MKGNLITLYSKMSYLAKLSKKELLIKCNELGITKCKSKTKPVLISMINERIVPTVHREIITLPYTVNIKAFDAFKKIYKLHMNIIYSLPSVTIGSVVINYTSIFSFSTISSRDSNDSVNKIREAVILFIVNNLSNNPYRYSYVWRKFIHNVYRFIINVFNTTALYPEVLFKCTLASGRQHNYDFMFDMIHTSTNTNTVQPIEFKYNSTKVSECPQFLSLSSKLNTEYAEFFYDEYVDKITILYNLCSIDRDLYLSIVHTTNYELHPWFNQLYTLENSDIEKKQLKKNMVDESIHRYLTELYVPKIDDDVIEWWNNKFNKTQHNKVYMLYDPKKKQFTSDKIDTSELTIYKLQMDVCVNKSNKVHTLVFSTSENTNIKMLLRWRNHAGILNPAWQISIKRNT